MKRKIFLMLCVSMFATSTFAMPVLGGGSLFSGAGEALEFPEFPTYTDPVMETSIQEEETPL